jgi:hypothetical protein
MRRLQAQGGAGQNGLASAPPRAAETGMTGQKGLASPAPRNHPLAIPCNAPPRGVDTA